MNEKSKKQVNKINQPKLLLNSFKQDYPTIPTPPYQEKYLELRNKLDKLKYTYHMDVSSMQLVDTLVNDIHKYLHRINKLTDENSKLTSEQENVTLQYKAYKNENLRLVKENNELHKELLELKKSINLSSHDRSSEIRKQNEEGGFKYLYTSAKEKMEKLNEENNQLRMKLLGVLHRIYERNMDENNLRKMFEEGERLFQIEKFEKFGGNTSFLDSNDNNLGIIVKPRGINMNMGINLISNEVQSNNLDISASALNNNTNILEKPKLLKDAIKETFQNLNINSENISPIIPALDTNNSHIPSNTNTISQNLTQTNFRPNHTHENLFNQLQEKINHLESELKAKSIELKRLEYFTRAETSSNSNDQLVIKYLKEENKKIKEKYEHRLDLLSNDNRNYEQINKDLSYRKKQLENYHPYIKELEFKVKDLEQKICEYNKLNLNKKISDLTIENQKLKFEFEDYKQNYIHKRLIGSKDEKIQQIKEEYETNHILIKRLEDRLNEVTSAANTTTGVLNKELKDIKDKYDKILSEFTKVKDENVYLTKENEELTENSNLLKMKILQQESLYSEQLEKVDDFSKGTLQVEREKDKLLKEIRKLNEDLNMVRKEIILKDNEIHRLHSDNFMLEKRIEILEYKINN